MHSSYLRITADQGTSQIVNTYGSQEFVDYLVDAYGMEIDVEDLYTDNSSSNFAIALYDDDATTPAAWDVMVDMGDYFGYQSFSNYTFITYSDYSKGKFSGGDLMISDVDGSFVISVADDDMNGSVAKKLFGLADGTGRYQMTMDGALVGDEISGTLVVSFWYGDMTNPYTQEIEFTAVKQ